MDDLKLGRARRRTGLLWFHAGVALGALVHPAHASAQEPSTHSLEQALEVSPGECVHHAPLVDGVQLWLGRGAIDARLTVAVEELPGGEVRILVKRRGEAPAKRLLKAESLACPDRRAAVALAIAMAIDAAVLQTVVQLEEESEPPVTRAPSTSQPRHEPSPRRASPQRAPPTPPRRQPLESELRLMGLYGVLPEPALAGFIGAVIGLGGRLSLRLGGWTTQQVSTPVAGGDARIRLTGGELDGCLTRNSGSLRVRGCAGFAAGRWAAQGRGFYPSRDTAVPWVAVQSGLDLGVRLAGWVVLSLRADAQLLVVQPVLQVHDDDGAVVGSFEPPPVGLRAGPGLTVIFE